jgi:4-hydroxythreonine-4-phosphate dehydrogenase
MRPRLAVTLGDPRGIGPEVVAAALADRTIQDACECVVVGPEGTATGVHERVGRWSPDGGPAAAGRLAGLAISRAVELARTGAVDGIVTAPIDKAALLAGGYDFAGHTEMLAALTGARVTMLLASDRLRVALATGHVALRDVPGLVTTERLVACAAVTREYLTRWFGIEKPRLALCALNPHAGDGRRFGNEDEDVLRPAATAANMAGPYPADTVFVRALRGEFDAVVAPYHDVGMTAIKVASFGEAVNVTLGLPFPRTSPDHGTALDIAGRGLADASSMKRAILVCGEIVARTQSSGLRAQRSEESPP